MNWYKKAQLDNEIASTEFSGICYHGGIRNNESLQENISDDYSEWEAIWVTEDENVARDFALQYGVAANEIGVIYKLNVQLNKAAIFSHNDYAWEEFKKYNQCRDPRECIPYLKQAGYDGWITTGGFNTYLYQDIAVFGGRIDIIEAKILKDGVWTEYKDVSEFTETEE